MAAIFEASLGGTLFSSLADELVLVDIVEKPVEMDVQTAPLVLKDGLRRTICRRKALSVDLVFAIRTQDIARRSEVRDLVADWAGNGGALIVNTRPGKRLLHVVADTPPALGSSLRWTDTLTMNLTAYGRPFWQTSAAVTVSGTTTLNNTTGLYELHDVATPGGNLDAPCTFRIRNDSADANMTYAYIQAGETYMELTGMDIAPGGMAMATYEDGAIYIQSFAVDDPGELLHCRTPESSDELLLAPGVTSQISVKTDVPATVVFSATELWL